MAFLAAIPAAIGSFFGNIGLGTALSAAGTVVSGIGAMNQANYQAKVAQQNAKIAEENAQRASLQSQQEAQRADQELAALAGQQEAIQGASGLIGRSQMLTRKSTMRLGRQDALRIREGGHARSQNFMQQAADFRNEAAAQKSAGRMSLLAAGIGAAGSLFGSARPTSSPTAARFRKDPWVTSSGVSLRRRTV